MKVSKLVLLLLALPIVAELKAQDFVWAASMGGPAVEYTPSDRGNAIKTDASGNVYTTGNFIGTVDFDPGPGVYYLTAVNGSSTSSVSIDMFIQKLDVNGNFLWAKQIVGDSLSGGNGVTLDASNNIYITGFFRGTKDFDPGPGVYYLTSKSGFILKLDTNGNFIWAKDTGGAGSGITVDNGGNTFITGRFVETVDFDPGPGVYQLTSLGSSDVFVSKLDNLGNFLWAKQLGGTSHDYGSAIAIDPSGNIYITGAFHFTADFDPGPGVFNLAALIGDIFVWKLTNSGNLIWAKQMKGDLNAYGWGIAVDIAGNVYYTGRVWGTVDFDPGPGIYSLSSPDHWNIFTAKLNSSGDFVWAKQFGSIYSEEGLGITLDAAGNVYTTGYFDEITDFDPGPGTYNLSPTNSDVFIQKLDNSGNFLWAVAMGGLSWDVGYAITVSSAGDIYTTGSFRDTGDFDPGPGVYNLISKGSDDIFIQKLNSTQCPLVQAGLISGNATVCSGTSQTYSINAVSGATSYTWSLPSGWTGSSTTNSITTTAGTTGGNISVAANTNCGSHSPQTFAVMVNPLPSQPGVINGSNAVCQGSSQTYSISAASIGATSYTWTLPSGWTGNSTTNSITTIAGLNSGNISVKANNSCGSSPVQTLAITANTIVQPGTITGNTNVNVGQTVTYSIAPINTATGYNWSVTGGGNIVSGQNTPSVSINWSTAGNHTLSVNASNSCGTGNNQSIAITTSGNNNPGNDPFDIQIMPNLSRGTSYLTATRVMNKTIIVEIYNLTGQMVYSTKIKAGSNNYIQTLYLHSLATGMYQARIFIDNDKYFRTIVRIN